MTIDTDGSVTAVTVPSARPPRRSGPPGAILVPMSAPPDELVIERQAPINRIELPPTSWVEIISGFVRHADALFDELYESLPWQQTEVLRYDHYVPERRLGAGARTDAHATFRQTDLHLQSRFRVPFMGVSAILYRDGDDFQGLHSDREMRWLDETLIAIVVLGARRPFGPRPRATGGVPVERIPAGTDAHDVVLTPGEGDLLIMGGACQREWLHRVPHPPADPPRISPTWRWTRPRRPPHTDPTYYDGRSFSDADRRPGSRRRPA